MKKLILASLVLASQLSHAQLKNTNKSFFGKIADAVGLDESLSIDQKDEGFVLYGQPSDKQAAILELSKWSGKKAYGNYSLQSPVVIDSILPHTVKNNIYTRHLLNGPNCHNNALITSGLMSRRMYVGDMEMKKHLELYCEEISAPEVGAIGMQYSGGGMAYHSYVVVGESFTYEKMNVSGDQYPKFRRFGDSRKNSDNFYRCNKRTLTRSCSSDVLELGKAVDKLHLNTANLVRSLRNSSNLSAYKQEAHELQARVFRDGSCPEYQEMLEARIDSIIGTYTEIEMTGALYGKGTYDKGPRI